MMRVGGIAVVIIGAVLLTAGCEDPKTEMSFREVDPDFGGLQGGKTVRVLGDHVRLDIGYAVYFGKLRSPQVSIQNERGLLAVTPPRREPGAVDVTVRAENGEVFVLRKGFEYIDQAGNLLDEAESP